MSEKIRIDKLLSGLGLLSRSECKKTVKRGEILINGKACTSPAERADPDADEIFLRGQQIDSRQTVYYMLHKPAGVITATEDPNKPTVLDLIEDRRSSLFPVGRLDKDTTGILLITNDGQLCHRLLSPRYHVPKCYRALIDGVLTDADIKLLIRGLDIGDERPTLPAEVVTKDQKSPQTVLLTITEGRYHQVKRMFEAVGKPVIELHRQSFGPLYLDPELAPGQYRELTAEELSSLKNACEKKDSYAAGSDTVGTSDN